jgi:hypothetical protein
VSREQSFQQADPYAGLPGVGRLRQVGSDNGQRHLAGLLGDDFLAGVVLYTGGTTASFGKRLSAMPVSALWQVGA